MNEVAVDLSASMFLHLFKLTGIVPTINESAQSDQRIRCPHEEILGP